MALRKNAKAELIGKVPLFAHCSKKDLAAVASIADEIDLPAGKALTREGDRGREFFVLLDGEAEVKKKKRKVRTLGAGDFLGEIALVSGAPRTATVTTTEPVHALVITDRDFHMLLKRNPEIQLRVLEALAERVAETSL